jgi:hypothetical protein
MQKENKALWKAKPLLTKLVGDNTWAPCGLMTAPDDRDASLFTDTVSFFNRPSRRAPADASGAPSINGGPAAQQNTVTGSTRASDNAEQHKNSGQSAADGETLPDAGVETNGERETDAATGPRVNGNSTNGVENKGQPADEDVEMAEPSAADPSTAQDQDSARPTAPSVLPPPNLDATSPATSAPDEFFIHPLFRLPPAAHPERDLGLPDQEAEEVRRLLLLYVQKQEEICRGTKRLYEGLLKADRLRKTVWQWSKAEAHCGPNRDMSDGEDWYDKEEWGLTEDLKKGEDEVEEDTAQTQKKTRNRK